MITHGLRYYILDLWGTMMFLLVTSPCRFVRRGRAAKGDDKDFDLASDVEDAELITWLEKPGLSTALQLIQSKDSKKMTKYLPPGTVNDLFTQYSATRQLLHAPAVSYATFMRVYKERWADVLKFREQNLHLRTTKMSSTCFCFMI